MFCTSDYVPLSVLWDKIPEANFNLAYETGLSYDPRDPTYALGVTASDWLEVDFFKFISGSTHICSPEGLLLMIDFRLLRTDEFTVNDLLQNPESKDLFEADLEGHLSARRLFDFPASDFILDGLKVADSYWKASLELGLQRLHAQLPLFYTRDSYSISMFMFDHLDSQNFFETIERKSIARMLRPFEGWSLCLPKEVVENKWDDFWIEKLKPVQGDAKLIGAGRPRKQEEVLAYLKLLPDGFVESSRKKVALALFEKTGKRFSVSTISRALDQNNNQN